jgi:hypothetical protein
MSGNDRFMTSFLAEDHRRLERLLSVVDAHPHQRDHAVYDQFRCGLLRHIAMEEKVLLPTVQRVHGAALPIAAKLRLDHGALASLLMLPPRPDVLTLIRAILQAHNALEEGPEGLYATCDRSLEQEATPLLIELGKTPEVSVAPTTHKAGVVNVVRRIVARAGYALADSMARGTEPPESV